MTHIDYSKIQINLSKVIINIIISSYFYGLGIMLLINHNRAFFDKQSYHDFLYPAIFFVLSCVILVFMYNIYKRTKLIPLFIFAFLVLLFFFIRDKYSLFLLTVSVVFIYAAYSILLLVNYSIKHNDFIKQYKHMINFDKYMANFYAIIAVLLLYYLFLVVYESTQLYQNFKPIKRDSVYILHLFTPLLLFFFVMIISSVFLFNIRYVLMLCPLSVYKEVPLSDINFIFNSSMIDKEYRKRWFKSNISIYLKDVSLNEECTMIVFENININDDKKVENNTSFQGQAFTYEDTLYSLDNAVQKIENLMTQLVYRGTNLTSILFNMKTYLEKINILHKDKNRYDKYIYRINNRYIPYIEYLVETYLQNMELKDEKVGKLQEKIELSLKNIMKVFQSMYESNVENMKFKIENEIDAMELLIRQKGFVNDEKK